MQPLSMQNTSYSEPARTNPCKTKEEEKTFDIYAILAKQIQSFKLKKRKCKKLQIFFCVIDGNVRTTHDEPTPSLPKFPCYDSESVSRKKRHSSQETIGRSKATFIL